MARAPRTTRLLEVAFVNSYGQREILAHVSCIDPESGEVRRESDYHTARKTGPFSGESLSDLRMNCYVGHYHDRHTEPDRLWGWSHSFKPHQVGSARDAERMLRTFRAIERADRRLSDELGLGHPQTFAMYLRRMAAIVGATEIRIWIPQEGPRRTYLSEPLQLAHGADLVCSIAGEWGRSPYAECPSATVRGVLDPPTMGPVLPYRSPLWLDLHDCGWCAVCSAPVPDSEDPDGRHREVSPRCYTEEALDMVDRLRAEHAQVRASV